MGDHEARVPRMRTAEEGGPAGAVRCTGAVSDAGAGNPARSVT